MPDNFTSKQRRWIEGGLERVGKLGLRLGLMTIEGKMDQPWIQDLPIDSFVAGSLFSYILPQELDKPIGRAVESDD